MKKTFLLAFAGLLSIFGFAQTATNFTVNDCAATSHTLFTELDAGKVVVLCWVMPCGMCVAGAKAAYNVVQGYQSTNPGKVVFYLADDLANTTCSSLSNWATTNAITNSTKFSNAAISMSNYGGAPSGMMAKTVVICGTNHSVVYNVNGTPSSTAMKSAIDGCLATGIADPVNEIATLQVFPNPADNSTGMSYSLSNASDVKIEIYNVLGEKVKSIFSGQQTAGEYHVNVNCAELHNGIYFVKLAAGETEKTVILSVSH